MSRIHEALKKAAQERSTQIGAGLDRDVADVAAEIHRPVTVEPVVAVLAEQPRATIGGGHTGSMRYEEIVRRCSRPDWRLDPRASAFQDPNSGHSGAERFRTLRSRLSQIAGTRTLRRLLITSSVAGEGKTFVASNLGQSIVRQPGRRVLLLDADIRMSRLHVGLGAPSRPGLTEYLRGEADEYSIIQKGMEGNLFLIPGGSPVFNPSELLLHERMKRLLDLLTSAFDWIIIDSPPALLVHDASILADLADGVLFVVQAGMTHVGEAEKAAEEFQNKNLLGVVLNKVEKRDSYGAYYHGHLSENAEKAT